MILTNATVTKVPTKSNQNYWLKLSTPRSVVPLAMFIKCTCSAHLQLCFMQFQFVYKERKKTLLAHGIKVSGELENFAPLIRRHTTQRTFGGTSQISYLLFEQIKIRNQILWYFSVRRVDIVYTVDMDLNELHCLH